MTLSSTNTGKKTCEKEQLLITGYDKNKRYTSLLDNKETEKAIKLVKDAFITSLEKKLNLLKVAAPLAVREGEGINDDLSGNEQPVRFSVKHINTKASIVQSLAKWKRIRLSNLRMEAGEGIWTDMKALRPDEILSPIHSVLVDQWDWEKCISPSQKNLNFLKTHVECIYDSLKYAESAVCSEYKQIKPFLPPFLKFIHSEELFEMYPESTPKERENEIASKYGAVFIIGIGSKLGDGHPHDLRAPDYDDWSTLTVNSFKGLNGDIIVYNPVTKSAFEISSMGIRVDAIALKKQLEISNCTERMKLNYHRMLAKGKLPSCIGGGIGQSRVCMLLLRKAHIGEVQAGVWPKEIILEYAERGIELI